MTATTKVPLGTATLNRKWYLDVNTNTYADPIWTGIFGVSDFKEGKDPTLEDDADFDSGGWKSSSVSALGWSLECKLQRKVKASDVTLYDPGQEVLRTASDLMGIGNTVDVRWYEMTVGGPKVQAYRGYATVSWVPDGGNMEALDTVTVTLTGKGTRTPITHPDFAASVPVVVSILPVTGATAGGEAAIVHGQFFTGVTAVKIGVTSVTDYQLVNDNEIAIVTPAKVAGPFTVYVTNVTGTNATGPTFTYS